jgi:hypothetical protein
MRGTFFQMDISQGIDSLDKRLDNLSLSDRALFSQLYAVQVNRGKIVIPEHLRGWAAKQFGSLDAVENQIVVRVTNKVTGEESIFNNMRARRPCDTRQTEPVRLDTLDSCGDTFARPMETTPEDTFGRLRGKRCVTASNIAKCEEMHGVVIFDEFNPLKWGREEIADYFDTAWRWAQKAHGSHPRNKYFFFCWNCLWRSGASINHGHAQMTLSRGRAFSHIEHLRKSALAYHRRGDSNYFDDLFKVHKSLGLAIDRDGVRVLAYLTPAKSNEIVIMADRINSAFTDALYNALALYRDRLGVTSFNLAVATPPMDRTRESWQGFPVIGWMVDRGKLEYRSSDIGSLELFAANSVASDPFKLAELLKT